MLRQWKWIAVLLAGAAQAQTNTLNRPCDPVVLTGQDLPAFTNLLPSQIVAFRYISGWQQIPVQIDERKVVDFGQVYNTNAFGVVTLAYADVNTYCGGDSNPTFDADDELVFMAKDTANRAAPATCLPTGVLTNSPVELTVTDPLDGGTGYVYLFRSNGSLAPGAGTNYVSYTFNLLAGSYIPNYDTRSGPNLEDSAVTTPYYREHFSDRWIHNQTQVFTAGSDGIDILDRHQNQFAPGICSRTEDTFSNGEGAFFANKTGPVRAVRSYMGANSGPTTERDHLFYELRHDITPHLRVHAIPSVMDLYDYATNATGMTYFNDLNLSGATINSVQDSLTVGSIVWEMVSGPHGTLIFSHSFVTDITNFTYRSYYSDTFTPLPAPCTGDPFEFGRSGLWITNAIPNTDPDLGAFNTLATTRVIYFEPANQSIQTAALRHQQAQTPLLVAAATFLGDSDCDGLADAWELSVFGNLIHSGTADDDGDGASNEAEYIAGTNPTSSASYPSLNISSSSGQANIVFAALKADGVGYAGLSRYYTLQERADLAQGPWNPVPGYTDILATNQTVTYTAPLAGSRHFYRTRIRLQ